MPMAPDELSTSSIAGETRSRKSTAPSAASGGSVRATFLISRTASLIRSIAGCDFHPKLQRRKRVLNSHSCGTVPLAPLVVIGPPHRAARGARCAMSCHAPFPVGPKALRRHTPRPPHVTVRPGPEIPTPVRMEHPWWLLHLRHI